MKQYNGKYCVPSRAKLQGKRYIVAALALALVLVCTVGGTLAYIFTHTPEVKNIFTPAKNEISVDEEFDGDVKKYVKVKNTGDVKSFMRVAVVINWVSDADPKVVLPAVAGDYSIIYASGTGWVEGNDGFWYYTSAVEAGKETGVLISECKPLVEKPGYHLEVEILANSIQAEPANVVTSTWGVDPTTLS